MAGSNRVYGQVYNAALLQRELNTFRRKSTQRDVLMRALRPGADLVLRAAQARVPERTGALKRSLVVTPDSRQQAPNVGLVVGHTGPRARIAHLVEFGTRFARAQSYMRRALSATRDQVQQLFLAEFRKTLDATARNMRTLRRR